MFEHEHAIMEQLPKDIIAAIEGYERAVLSDDYRPGGRIDVAYADLCVAIIQHLQNAGLSRRQA